jgi:hypothetical protein
MRKTDVYRTREGQFICWAGHPGYKSLECPYCEFNRSELGYGK